MALIYDLSEYRRKREDKKKKLALVVPDKDKEILDVVFKTGQIHKFLVVTQPTIDQEKLAVAVDSAFTFGIDHVIHLVLFSTPDDWCSNPELYLALVDEVRGREYFNPR